MVRARLASVVPGRQPLLWTTVYPGAVVLPIVAASFVYPPAKFALLVVGIPAGMAFGFMGEDFRGQSAESAVYYRNVDPIRNDENPDERLGSVKYLWFTGGLAFGSLALLALLFVYA